MEFNSFKPLFSLSLFLFAAFFSFAQESQIPPSYLDCQIFKGGKRQECTLTKLKQFVYVNADYSKMGFHFHGLQRIYCDLTINPKGEAEDIKAEGATLESGVEVERVLENLPRFFPARKNGKPVAQNLSFVVVYNKNKESVPEIQSVFSECETGNRAETAECESQKLERYVQSRMVENDRFEASEYGELFSVEISKGENGKYKKVHVTGSSKSTDSIVKRIVEKMPALQSVKRDEMATFQIPIFLKFKHKGDRKPKKKDSLKAKSIQKIDKKRIVPIYPGCEWSTTNRERKACLANKISEFISSHFNKGAVENYKRKGIYKIYCQFVVDTTGKLVNIKARATMKGLTVEAKRVLKQLPKMKPGKQRGKLVKVMYTLPIVFRID